MSFSKTKTLQIRVLAACSLIATSCHQQGSQRQNTPQRGEQPQSTAQSKPSASAPNTESGPTQLNTNNSGTSLAQPMSGIQTACVSFQGNGPKFTSHLGTSIALLERNIQPVVAAGGSSGAFAAAIVRGLLSNPSLAGAQISDATGTPLTLPQKAARVLSASYPVIDSGMLTPQYDRLLATIKNVLAYTYSEKVATALLSFPNQAIANIDTTTGQSLLIIDFLTTQDFTELLQESSFQGRERIMKKLWMQTGDFLEVSPREFAVALITPPSSEKNTPRVEEIKRRYFGMFRQNSDNGRSADNLLKRVNTVLDRLKPLLAQVSDDTIEKTFLDAMAKLEGAPFLGELAQRFSRNLLLFSPEKIQTLLAGTSLNGGPLHMPAGTVIHTSARAAAPIGFRKTLVERDGIQNFYQVLFPSSEIGTAMQQAHSELPAGRSLMEFEDPKTHELQPLLPNTNVIVARESSFVSAIGLSMSEPGAFERRTIELSESDKQNNSAPLATGDSLVTFGGWFDMFPSRTLQTIPACGDADYFVHVGRNTFVEGFQFRGLRTVFLGMQSSLNRETEEQMQDPSHMSALANFYRAFGNYRAHSWSVSGKKAALRLDFDWENISPQQDISDAIKTNRRALMLASYEDAAAKLDAAVSAPAPRPQGELTFAPQMIQTPLNAFSSVEELKNFLKSFSAE